MKGCILMDDKEKNIGIGMSIGSVIGFFAIGVGAAVIATPIIATYAAIAGLAGGAVLGGHIVNAMRK